MPIRLTVRDTQGDDDKTFELDFDGALVRIGRSSQNDIQLPNRRVSFSHCRIIAEGNDYFLVDSGSTNGTRLNGVRVAIDDPKLLRDGDVITIENFELRVGLLTAFGLTEGEGEKTSVVARRMVMEVLSSLGEDCPTLRFLSGPLSGTVTELSREGMEITIGRSSDADVSIKERAISRLHARLRRTWEGVFIEDLGSANGVFVNDERIQGERKLKDRDEIRLGTVVKMVFSDPNAAILAELDGIPDPLEAPDRKEPFVLPLPEEPAPAEPEPEPEPEEPVAGGTIVMSMSSDLVAEVRREKEELEQVLSQAEEVAPKESLRLMIGISAAALVLLSIALYLFLHPAPPPPLLRSVTPARAVPGVLVTLRGEHFGAADEGEPLAVFFDDLPGSIEARSDQAVALRVPQTTQFGKVTLRLRRGDADSLNTLTFVILNRPIVEGVEPEQPRAGAEMVIRGEGFSPELFNNEVFFGEIKAQVVKATPDELRVVVPSELEAGTVDLHVRVAGLDSGALSLKVLGAVVLPFQLTFMAAPPTPSSPDRIIQTALGPVLYLRGRGVEPTVEQRVRRAIEALNAARKRLEDYPTATIRMRVEPSAGAVSLWQITADGHLRERVLRVTGEDVAGYREQSGRSLDAEQLGSWWAALLSDYFRVFVLGEAPQFTSDFVEAPSPLLTIHRDYREGKDIPATLVDRLPLEVREKLVRLARVVPPRFGRVDGQWEGEIDIAFSRRYHTGMMEARGRIGQKGSRLSGTLKIRNVRTVGGSGRATSSWMTRTLREGTFGVDGWGEVRFILRNDGGESFQFRGTLEGRRIAGRFQALKGERAGRFSFKIK